MSSMMDLKLMNKIRCQIIINEITAIARQLEENAIDESDLEYEKGEYLIDMVHILENEVRTLRRDLYKEMINRAGR